MPRESTLTTRDHLHREAVVYVQAAFFCERVTIEENQTLTFNKLLTHLNVQVTGGPPSGTMPPITINPAIVVALTSEKLRGKYDLALSMVRPDGLRLGSASLPVEFEGPGIIRPTFTQVSVPIEMQGIYWFDLLFEGKQLTRIPLQIVYDVPSRRPVVAQSESADLQVQV